jgi:hypothetical protein
MEECAMNVNEVLRFLCPHCAKSIHTDRRHAGKRGKCPRCKTMVVAPECLTCQGRRKIPCRECSGKGFHVEIFPTDPCPACDGSGIDPDSGESPCICCGGRGGPPESESQFECLYCDAGEVECPDCNSMDETPDE